MKHIVIVGGGFCGTLTAVNLIKGAKSPLKITLVNSGSPLVLGVAYSAYSRQHLLNVAAGNMSAFPDDKNHFVDWLLTHQEYHSYEKDLLAKTFMPRNLYGEYLTDIWNNALEKKGPNIELTIINDYVSDIDLTDKLAKVILQKGAPIIADYIVLATGNSQPGNPTMANMAYYSSPTYFRNPWSIDSVKHLKPEGDVLIIGNGLTMVDTAIGLLEQGFQNKIYSISTNGFGVLPHRHMGVAYEDAVKEIKTDFELNKLVNIVHKHIKKVRKLGISAEPVIDSLRPYSQKIWQSFSLAEKKRFISKFRHRWGVARHRLPIFIYDIIEKLRINGQLRVHPGKLMTITETAEEVTMKFYNTHTKREEALKVQRVINCTGPESSVFKTLNPLLNKLAEKGIITPDPLELGINTDITTYSVLTKEGKKSPYLYTLGPNLKGQLWESIAVPELRVQCSELAGVLLKVCEEGK